MVSHSMAKTIVAMLVGVALSERTIQSLDDPSAKYVAELTGTPYGQTPLRHLLTMSSGVQFAEGYTGNSGLATLFRLSALGESAGGAATVMPFRRERARAGWRCQACGRGGRLDVHHVVKRSQGGSDLDLDALAALCRRCHAQADAPFVKGRLIVTPRGGQFAFEVVTIPCRTLALPDASEGGAETSPAALPVESGRKGR